MPMTDDDQRRILGLPREPAHRSLKEALRDGPFSLRDDFEQKTFRDGPQADFFGELRWTE